MKKPAATPASSHPDQHFYSDKNSPCEEFLQYLDKTNRELEYICIFVYHLLWELETEMRGGFLYRKV